MGKPSTAVNDQASQSLWIATTPRTQYPTVLDLSTQATTNVVIIGGGIAGLTTAYLLQQAGAKVVVLEKERIIEGVSGNTSAKITSLHTLKYHSLMQTFGEETARIYGEANQAGLEKIASLTESLGIDCDFKRTNAYTFAESEKDLTKIEDEVKAAQRLGLPASFEATLDLPIAHVGAIRFSNQAQFHPRKYLIGLAEAFVQAGGQIIENTRVLNVEHVSKTQCELTTSQGNLRASQVIITTHYPIYDPAFYFSRLSPHRSCVLALSLDEPVIEGMYISSSPEGYSFRNQPDGDETLFIVGGEHYRTGQGGNILERYIQLEAYGRKHFAVKEVRYHWSTQDNATLDGLPYVGNISPNSDNVFVATGFDGWGMTNGTAAGILLSDKIMGIKNRWEDTFSPNRFKPTVSAVGQLVSEGINSGKELLKGFLPKSKLIAENLPKAGEGDIFDTDDGKIAVSCDANGQHLAVSAVCTHLGCIVVWNNAELSWDCPCHASRFAADGKVLHGPAVKDLEQKELTTLEA